MAGAATSTDSVQAMTRTLRAASVPLDERLRLASTLLTSRALHLPGKTEVLLDWIMQTLVRSLPAQQQQQQQQAGHSKGTQKVRHDKQPQQQEPACGSPAYLSLGAWRFLARMLGSLVPSKARDAHADSSRVPDVDGSDLPAVEGIQLKVPLTPLFASLIRASDELLSGDSDSHELLDEARTVFVLATTTLSNVARITADQLGPLALNVLEELHARMARNEHFSDAYWRLCMAILTRTQREQAISPNPKKIEHVMFQADNIAELSTLVLDLGNRRMGTNVQTSLERANGGPTAETPTSVSTKATDKPMPDATSGKEDKKLQENQKAVSYSYDLIDVLVKGAAEADGRRAIVEMLPILHQCFFAAMRSRGNPKQLALSVFCFFVEMQSLALPSELKTIVSPSDLQVLSRLLHQLLHHDVFRPAGDDRSKAQRAMLVGIFERLCKIACSLGRADTRQTHIFSAMSCLIKLDFAIVADRIDVLWPLVLGESAREAAMPLLLELLGMFVKSRELDGLLRSMLSKIREEPWRSQALHLSVFDDRWVSAFGDALATMLPAQSVSIVDLLRAELLESYGATLTPANANDQPSKKRKTASGQKARPSLSDARIVVKLLCAAIARVLPAHPQNETLKQIAAGLHSDFVKPCINLVKDCDTDVLDQTRIVCTHVTRQVGVSPDPSAELDCRASLHQLLETLSLDSMPLAHETHLVVAWQTLLSNMFAVSHVVDQDHLAQIVVTLVLSLEHTPLADLWRAETPTSCSLFSAQLLQHAPFFEIAPIRNLLVGAVLARIRSNLKEAFGKSKPAKRMLKVLGDIGDAFSPADLATQTEATIQLAAAALAASDADEASETHTTRLKTSTKGGKSKSKLEPTAEAAPSAEEGTWAQVVDSEALSAAVNLIQVLLVFPIAYFSQHERDMIMHAIFVTELVLMRSNTATAAPALWLPSILSCRRLGLRFMSSRQDRMLPLFDPQILRAYLRVPAKQSDAAAHSNALHDAIVQETAGIAELVISTVLRKFGDKSLVKGGQLQPTAFLEQAWQTLDSDAVFDLVRVRAVAGVNEHLRASKAPTDLAVLRDAPAFGAVVKRIHRIAVDESGAAAAVVGPALRELSSFFKLSSDPRLHELLAHIGASVERQHAASESVLLATQIAALLEWVEDIDSSVLAMNFADWIQRMWRMMPKHAMLRTAFAHHAQRSPYEHYLTVVDYHVKKLASITEHTMFASANEPEGVVGLIQALGVLLATPNANGTRKPIRSAVPAVLTHCAALAERTRRFGTIAAILDLALAIAADRQIDMSSGDVSLLIAVIQSAGTNAHAARAERQREPLREAQMTGPDSVLEQRIDADSHPKANRGRAADQAALFDLMCQVLVSLLRTRRDAVIRLIPVFIAPVVALLGSLRDQPRLQITSAHRRQLQQAGQRLAQQSAQAATQQTGSTDKPHAQHSAQLHGTGAVFVDEPFAVFDGATPLPVSCAKSLSRALSAMTQKPAIDNEGSHGSAHADGVGGSAGDADGQNDRLASQYAKTIKPFSKHAPFVLSRVVHIQVSARPFSPAVKDALRLGVFALLDLCDDYGRGAVLAALDGGGRSAGGGGGRHIFKDFVAAWEREHRLDMSDIQTRVAALQARPECVRNICILAHVDHGKTTLSDGLLSSNGIISSKLSGKVRYLDSRPDEQERGITMKSSGISLFFNVVQHVRAPGSDEVVTRTNEYLINLIDSPGHVDFSSEVSTASRLCDGGLVLVDVVEGVCTQVRAAEDAGVTAWTEKVKPILVLNKIDRLITELKMTPIEAYMQLNKVLEQVNAILGGFYSEELMEDATKRYEAELASRESMAVDVGAVGAEAADAKAGGDKVDADEPMDDSDLYFDPSRGNVIFASAIDGWAFRTSQFAQLYAAKLGVKESQLSKVLWGNFYLDAKAKKVVGRQGLKGRALKPLFVQFVLENIWAVYQAALIEPDRDKVEKIVKALGIKVLPRDLKTKDLRSLTQTLMSQWLPLSRSVLMAVVQHVPSPVVAQAKRLPQILHPELAEKRVGSVGALAASAAESETPERAALDAAVYACDASAEAPVVAYISKMYGVPRDLLPKQQKATSYTPDEMRRRREEIMARSKALDREKSIAGVGDAEAPAKQPRSAPVVAADADNDEVLIGFARIYSGTISVGQKIQVLDPKYDPTAPDRSQHVSEATVERLFLMMGRDLHDLEKVPAGSVFGIMGLQSQVLKTATVTTSEACPSLAGLKLDAAPIVRVALEPADPTQLNQLLEGLRLLNRADPCVEVHLESTGENVIVCAGELHLERCLKDLRERFARINIQASPPIVPFRETLSPFPSIPKTLPALPTGTVQVSTKNKLFSIRIRALPLPASVRTFLADAGPRLQSLDAIKNVSERALSAAALEKELRACIAKAVKEDKDVVAKVDWDAVLSQIVAFGPKGIGANILTCTAPGYEMNGWATSVGKKERRRQATEEETPVADSAKAQQRAGDYETSIVSGFQMATAAGPLCAEPMSGVCFVVEDVQVFPPSDDDDPAKVAALPGQIITTVREGARQAFLGWSPRLMLAMYSCDLQTPTDTLGKVYAVLNRRRGRILSEDMKEGTDFFQIMSVLPVIESFGFADELRKRTSGAASPQLLFTGFEVLDEDPFWVPTTEEELEDLGEKADRENLAKRYMEAVRKRKGMAIEKKVVEHAEKQKTLKNK
nr:Cytoplasmic GTPase/eEF2-like protein (ribosomal biogenesis) [Polyrhizophydium stewartii]